ncbi:hypothetical protein AAFF_G00022340 [Aldrovandia affinis]|uniref:Tubulin--tyrosine ligase-like protein 9 n=1 Tax=Aldrovandia affinis TaxID=143900 RepID=A0AAD7R2J4_9TELE|nr:hypothetical protein AAFF_G00022340 [Aldrovandia affinis]
MSQQLSARAAGWSQSQNAGSKVAYDNGKRKEGEGRGYVRYKCPPTKTLQDVLRQRPGWLEGQDEEWDFHWCDVGWLRENYGHAYLEDHVRICHFGNHYELTRKNLMASPAEAARCDFFPCTFELPCEYHLFVEEFKRSPGGTWIMKPAARSQGRGIFLFRRLKDVTDWRREHGRADEPRDEAAPVESYVAQRYIEDPYLISGRSSTCASTCCIRDQYAHLTNVAVQCTAPDYDPERGCKWQLQQLRPVPDGAPTAPGRLQSVQKVIINDKHCFELYGYDIILDKGLKPWLIEVNASPSLNATCQQDYELKCRLLEDTLNVVDMEGRLTGREAQVGGFDLMWSDGPVYREDVNPPASGSPFRTPNTHLGCFNDRKSQLRKLFKPLAGQMAV